MPALDVERLRREFPALELMHDDRPAVFLDGPGGTQVPRRVIDAVADYYRTSNANSGGAFVTSERSDAMVAETRAAVAAFLGAADPEEIKFGANMTTLTFHVSRAIAATFEPGDEIVVTTLDHEANVAPWQAVARERDLVIRTVDIHPEDVTLDLDALDAVLSPRTRLVAFGYASNAVGTISPVRDIVARVHAAGALAYVDAVHYAPHGPIDVAALATDFLVCSTYKWFGPHQGVLYGRRDVLERLPSIKVRAAHDRFETGTPSFESIAGTLAAVDYLRDVGRSTGGTGDRRSELVAAMTAIATYELELGRRLLDGLSSIAGVRVHGITDRSALSERTPTYSITVEGISPREAAEALGRAGIFAWDGDFYAQALVERLGLAATGGLLRLGLVHYNTAGEVDRLLTELDRIAAPGTASTSRPIAVG
ncbi:MAG: cysteine desulfurase-like protein [Chloroflexota bacterium]